VAEASARHLSDSHHAHRALASSASTSDGDNASPGSRTSDPRTPTPRLPDPEHHDPDRVGTLPVRVDSIPVYVTPAHGLGCALVRERVGRRQAAARGACFRSPDADTRPPDTDHHDPDRVGTIPVYVTRAPGLGCAEPQ
jgi:hypothetical protein